MVIKIVTKFGSLFAIFNKYIPFKSVGLMLTGVAAYKLIVGLNLLNGLSPIELINFAFEYNFSGKIFKIDRFQSPPKCTKLAEPDFVSEVTDIDLDDSTLPDISKISFVRSKISNPDSESDDESDIKEREKKTYFLLGFLSSSVFILVITLLVE